MRARGSRLATAALVALALAASGCSGGGPFGDGDGADTTCKLIERLGRSADRVERADIENPDDFQAALDDAVVEYGRIIDDLLDSAPETLHDDLRALRAAVEQYRFSDAVDARATLDEYAASECGLQAPPTTLTTLALEPTVPTSTPTTLP
jgi:hypothetical protein